MLTEFTLLNNGSAGKLQLDHDRKI